MSWAKYGAIVILTAVVLMLAVQNGELAPVRFLAWHVDLPISALTLGPLLLGLVTARLHGVMQVRRLHRTNISPVTRDDRPADPSPAANAGSRSEAVPAGVIGARVS